MSGPGIGSLCTGYGGLDLAVLEVFGGEHVWMAENDPHAAAVLAHHWPAVPNLSDITGIDWTGIEPVDILAAGFPCQDISKARKAGQGDGIHGKRSGVWKNVVEAVRVLRPGLLVLENVAAIRSRGLDVVAADLAAIGYDAVWTCVRASGAGAPHERWRWFCLAWTASTGSVPAAHIQRGRRQRPQRRGVRLLPTPTARDWKSAASNKLDDNSRPLNEYVVGRLPGEGWVTTHGVDHGPAIRHWEAVVGRPAPRPTEPGTKGNRRLDPVFSEWMMGLPHGHVTSVPNVPRKHQLRVIGGGVVPLQGVSAIESLLGVLGLEAA